MFTKHLEAEKLYILSINKHMLVEHEILNPGVAGSIPTSAVAVWVFKV